MIGGPHGSFINSIVNGRDVITNTFDLASFLFITPELTAKYLGNGRLRWWANWVAFCLAGAVFLILFGLFVTALSYIPGKYAIWRQIILWAVLLPLGIYLVHKSDGNLVASVEASKHWLLAFGIALFILSRIIGLAAGLILEGSL